MKELLQRRKVRDDAEKREAKRLQSREGRQRAKEMNKRLKEQLEKRVAGGSLTLEAMEDELAKHYTGIEKIQQENVALRRRLKVYEEGEVQSALVRDAQAETASALQHAQHHQRHYLSKLVVGIQ